MSLTQRLKKVLVTFGILLLGGMAYLYFFLRFGFGLPCIFYQVTGWKCPGCGMTRAIAQIAQGNVSQALQYNMLCVSLLPVLLFYLLYRVVVYVRGADQSFKIWEYILLILMWIVTIGYGIARNIYV